MPFIRQASLTIGHGGDRVTQSGTGRFSLIRRQRYQFLQAAERPRRPGAGSAIDRSRPLWVSTGFIGSPRRPGMRTGFCGFPSCCKETHGSTSATPTSHERCSMKRLPCAALKKRAPVNSRFEAVCHSMAFRIRKPPLHTRLFSRRSIKPEIAIKEKIHIKSDKLTNQQLPTFQAGSCLKARPRSQWFGDFEGKLHGR